MNPENINIEDLKTDEMYNVRVKVHRMTPAGLVCYACDKDGHYLSEHPNFFTKDEVEAFSPITPENGTKNTASAPKYDPCRLFKKGDKVRVVTYKGRNKTGVSTGEIGLIDKDEKAADVTVEVIFYGDDLWEVDPAYLELVTPVEDLEPYSVGGSIDGCILYKNGIKNTEPAPKHDPCRLFKKGDKVRVVKCNGRIGSTSAPVGMLAIVTEDEKECSWIYLTTKECDYSIDPAYLELVTPVEDLEPYSVGGSIDGCILYKNGDYYAEFLNSEDAQRACKLLNAEHRKEQKNG